jgi:hypothetical protein
MKNLSQLDKAICVQGCINSYARIYGQNIPEGHGAHGRVDWSSYVNGEKGSNCVEWWQDFDGEKYSSGYVGYINHPKHGKIAIVCYQGTTSSCNKVGWKSNFDVEQVKVIRKWNSDKSGLIIPYGNENSKIKMHDGIVQIYGIRRTFVREFIKKAFEQGLPVWIFGHSQGGGVTTAAYIDFHYMFHTEMGVPQEKMDFLTGYAAAALAVGNLEFVKSFNKRANGNFYREHILGDPVPDTPPFIGMGYAHVDALKFYTDFGNSLLYGPTNILHFATLGFLPSPQIWNHDPRKLKAAVLGQPIPLFKIDTTNDMV